MIKKKQKPNKKNLSEITQIWWQTLYKLHHENYEIIILFEICKEFENELKKNFREKKYLWIF